MFSSCYSEISISGQQSVVMFEEGEFPIYKEMYEISHQAKLHFTPNPSIRHDVHRVPSNSTLQTMDLVEFFSKERRNI